MTLVVLYQVLFLNFMGADTRMLVLEEFSGPTSGQPKELHAMSMLMAQQIKMELPS